MGVVDPTDKTQPKTQYVNELYYDNYDEGV